MVNITKETLTVKVDVEVTEYIENKSKETGTSKSSIANNLIKIGISYYSNESSIQLALKAIGEQFTEDEKLEDARFEYIQKRLETLTKITDMLSVMNMTEFEKSKKLYELQKEVTDSRTEMVKLYREEINKETNLKEKEIMEKLCNSIDKINKAEKELFKSINDKSINEKTEENNKENERNDIK